MKSLKVADATWRQLNEIKLRDGKRSVDAVIAELLAIRPKRKAGRP